MQGTRGRRYLVPLVSVALSLVVAANLQAAPNFFDNIWPPTTTWVDTPISATGGSKFTTTTMPSGGVGSGPYRQTTNNYFGSSVIVAAHAALFASYVPSTQGSIASIDFSFYGKSFNGPQVGYWLLIIQNNTYYQGPVDIVVANSWTSFSNPGLTAGSFTVLSGPGPAQPDFSCMGSLIQFGFVTGNSNPSGDAGTAITTTSGIDDWSVTVNRGTPCCTLTGNIVSGCCLGPVPCPGSTTSSDFYSFLASVTLTGPASCTLAVIPSTPGLVIDSFGPTTLTAGANFVTGAFSGPQSGSNFSLLLSCTGSGGLQSSTTLTAPFPACQTVPPGNSNGTLSIEKVVDTPGVPSSMVFPISVNCGGVVTQMSLVNGLVQTVSAPAGTPCTVNEAVLPAFISPNCPAGTTWLPPTYSPSFTATISSSLAQLIVVHNAFTCNGER